MASSIISSASVASIKRASPAQASMVLPFTGLKPASAFPVTRKLNNDLTSLPSNGGRVQCMQRQQDWQRRFPQVPRAGREMVQEKTRVAPHLVPRVPRRARPPCQQPQNEWLHMVTNKEKKKKFRKDNHRTKRKEEVLTETGFRKQGEAQPEKEENQNSKSSVRRNSGRVTGCKNSSEEEVPGLRYL
ncbi:hypothetical protein HHK36_030027 [Tetracentron sinense]|uniref:Ribulose-1,5-bisphosphate carboxylase small subunit N-terminal domain-containing protein n=1 Tax=Tetracentron sinense TaxID=13715 RepID=A0A834YBX2_TETSI|nr:hypothetical protein HHK36_030027 [Tetracentron sinense]